MFPQQMNPYYYQQPTYPQAINVPQVTNNLRIVDDFNTINANDVPMSGISAFTKSDLSEVVIKRWTPQGTIQTLLYRAFTDNLTPQTTNVSTEENKSPYDDYKDVIQGLNGTLAEINSKIDKLMPSSVKKGTSNEPKSNS